VRRAATLGSSRLLSKAFIISWRKGDRTPDDLRERERGVLDTLDGEALGLHRKQKLLDQEKGGQ
jgi:hypothetical protein